MSEEKKGGRNVFTLCLVGRLAPQVVKQFKRRFEYSQIIFEAGQKGSFAHPKCETLTRLTVLGSAPQTALGLCA